MINTITTAVAILFAIKVRASHVKTKGIGKLQHEDFIVNQHDWDDVEKYLESILTNTSTKGACYFAGTLVIPFKGVHLFLNFGRNPEKIEILLAKIFLREKTPNHASWGEAKEIVERHSKAA